MHKFQQICFKTDYDLQPFLKVPWLALIVEQPALMIWHPCTVYFLSSRISSSIQVPDDLLNKIILIMHNGYFRL